MDRVLLIGATGRIGGATAAALQEKGIDFSVLARSGGDSDEWREAGVEQITGDVRDVASLKQAFSGFDALLSVSPFATDIDRTGANMVEAAKAASVARFVRSSALGAVPGAEMTLGRLHAAAEAVVRESGLDWTILQPATFMQNYLGFAGSIRSEGAFYSPLGGGRVSLVDVRDVGDMAAAVLTESGHAAKTYAVTGPEAISCADIAALMSAKLGRRIRYVEVSDEQAESAMRQSGMPDPLVGMVGELNRVSKAGHAAEVSPAVEHVLGRKPRTFADFLDAHAAAFEK